MYDKLRDHLFRIDDTVNCTRCRRRIEIPSHQTMVFLDELPDQPGRIRRLDRLIPQYTPGIIRQRTLRA